MFVKQQHASIGAALVFCLEVANFKFQNIVLYSIFDYLTSCLVSRISLVSCKIIILSFRFSRVARINDFHANSRVFIMLIASLKKMCWTAQ